jgi:hypothetical protein
MKKLALLLSFLVLLSIVPLEAAADESILKIDNQHVYDGMGQSYSEGYTPSVKNGVASVILPVLSSVSLNGSTLTATPNLGDTTASPFIYKNYLKNVPLSTNTVDGGTASISAYYIRFDLPLKSQRYNGVYPVAITLTGTTANWEPVSETFTVYITITDGKDANAQAAAGASVSQPVVIVSDYSVNRSPVQAGEECTISVTLQNTSTKKAVQNMTVTAGGGNASIILLNTSNVIYVDKLAKDSTTVIELRYKPSLDTAVGSYEINLALTYDTDEAQSLSCSGTITLAVEQPLRVELEKPSIPEDVNAGDTVPLSFHVVNLGRGVVYNVRCVIDAPGFLQTSSAFIGNMQPGSAGTGEMDVFIGTKQMSENYTGTESYGSTSGKVTLLYEDASGQEYSQEYNFMSAINAPVFESDDEEPQMVGQWWISLIIGAVVIAALAAVILIKRKRERQRHADI